jgi:urease accessory protein
LVWDAWALGRAARGERWAFERLVSRMRITREGVPLFVERMRLDAAVAHRDALTGAQGHAYVASWLVCAESLVESEGRTVAAELEAAVATLPGVRAAASVLARGGVLVRVLARAAYALTEAQQRLWAQTRSSLLNLPPIDLRKP